MSTDHDSDYTVGKEFSAFLKDSEKASIRVDGYDPDKGWCSARITGLHRFKPEYRKRVFAKVQCLNAWYEEHPSPVAMVTFTTRQRGLSKPEQIGLLKDSFNKAKKILNKRLGLFPYVWVMEAHDSGYSHIHLLIFKDIPCEVQTEIRQMWNEKYGAGGYSDAVQFDIREAQKSLRSAAAYVFAYVTKTMDSEALADPDSGYFKQSAWVHKMSQHKSPYKGVRTWGSSQDITEVMRRPESPSQVIWWRVNWKTEDMTEWFPRWIDEDMAACPERVAEFDSWLLQGDESDPPD